MTYTLAANVENLTLTGTANINATGNILGNVIAGNSGNNILDGGEGSDAMSGGAGNDTYIVDNAADTVMELASAGTDQILSSVSYGLSANVENLTLAGTGDINGTGNSLDNVLVGNAANNILDGGAGVDAMSGGAGDDTYIVDNTADTVMEASNAGTDIVLSGVSYTLSANVENLTLTGTGNTMATGNSLANIVIGNAGNNVLDGAAGADQMYGGAGNDTYIVDDAGDSVAENAGEGVDTLQSNISYQLSDNVENLKLTGTANVNATGNVLGNVLTGNAGSNVLDGGLGADTMAGGAGNDTYVVDNVGDTVTETLNAGTDQILSGVTYALSANVENITLTGILDINATGNELANVLVGNSGANRLDGGAGADAMSGGAGNDIYVVDNSGDTVVEIAGAGTDLILSNISYVLPVNVENITLTGAGNINATGNAQDNILIGNTGNNTLDGSVGADTMTGGLGDDTYIVDNVGDAVVELSLEGLDTVYTSISYVLPQNVENLILTSTGNIGIGGNSVDNALTGNSGANTMSGGDGNDTLDGKAGDDNLDGGQGNDQLLGGDGTDTLYGGAGLDKLDGGLGNDTYLINVGDGLDRIDDAGGTDTVKFGAGLNLNNVALRVTTLNGISTAHVRMLNIGGDEQDDQGFDFTVTVDRYNNVTSSIERFEFADGSAKTLNDLLIKSVTTNASSQATTITTGRDDNIIYGNSRTNTIYAGTGNDIVYAGSGNDAIFGEGGNDYLQGGGGDDTIDGGWGTDILAGSNGRDTLRDLNGSNAFLGGSQNDTIEAGDGNDFMAGGRNDDTIRTGGGNNVVAFNQHDGNDIILASVGAHNTLSLGGGIETDDLTFKRTGQDLLMNAGHGDLLTFKDWYAGEANRNFVTLQVIDDGFSLFDVFNSSSSTNKRVETFDFRGLVNKFDAARAGNSHLSEWSLMNGMLDTHLASNYSMALGGELAGRYSEDASFAMTPGAVQTILKDPQFGIQAQTVGTRVNDNIQTYRIA